MGVIILVCGGRNFKDVDLVFKTLDRVLVKYPEMIILTGSCESGADKFAEDWAKKNEIPYIGVPARWKEYGNTAGPIRNKLMRDKWKPNACIAFSGGSGTKGMVDLMREIDIEPWIVGWP